MRVIISAGSTGKRFGVYRLPTSTTNASLSSLNRLEFNVYHDVTQRIFPVQESDHLDVPINSFIPFLLFVHIGFAKILSITISSLKYTHIWGWLSYPRHRPVIHLQ